MKLRTLLLMSCFAAVPAVAQEGVSASSSGPARGQGWSVFGGKTVGESSTVVTGQIGWPGITAGLLHGVTSRADLGARFTFNYGYEGIVDQVVPGIKLQAVARFSFLEKGRFSLAGEFAPGPLFYFYGNRYTTYGAVGLILPVSLTAGVAVGSAVQLHFGLDVPMYAIFGNYGRMMIPILVGGGVEYFIDRNLAATFDVKMGPTVDTYGYRDRFGNFYYSQASFTLNALFGVAYRF